MGWTGHTLGTLLPSSPEATRFRGYFGISAEVAVEAWEMMEELDCLPPPITSVSTLFVGTRIYAIVPSK